MTKDVVSITIKGVLAARFNSIPEAINWMSALTNKNVDSPAPQREVISRKKRGFTAKRWTLAEDKILCDNIKAPLAFVRNHPELRKNHSKNGIGWRFGQVKMRQINQFSEENRNLINKCLDGKTDK